MAKKYIEREAAIDAMTADNLLKHFDSVEDVIENRFHRAAERILASIPAADVVPVVRCRECKHSVMYKFTYNYERVLVCNAPGVTIRAVKPMHFCADGKRKDGGQDE